jgi:hypothetical protein
MNEKALKKNMHAPFTIVFIAEEMKLKRPKAPDSLNASSVESLFRLGSPASLGLSVLLRSVDSETVKLRFSL